MYRYRQKNKNTVIQRIFGQLLEKIHRIPLIHDLGKGRELLIFLFFVFLFLVLLIKLFYLSIINNKKAEEQLNRQHSSVSLLKAKRGKVFAVNKSGDPVSLTENITLYTIFVDPKLVWDKNKLITILSPVLYKHFCQYYGLQKITQYQCIRNLEIFTKEEILPKTPDRIYYGSGIEKIDFHGFRDMTGYNQKLSEIISGFTQNKAEYLIKKGLSDKIKIGMRDLNYLGFFSNTDIIEYIKDLNKPYIQIRDQNYVYINPHIVSRRHIDEEQKILKDFLMKYGYPEIIPRLSHVFVPQENRYVRIATNANSEIAHDIENLKDEYFGTTMSIAHEGNVSILQGVGLEENPIRYYPLGSFLANALGYLDKHGNSFYGIENGLDEVLRGVDGEIEGRASSRIGGVGANEFEIKNVQHGSDVYLTIDVGIQKKIEEIAKQGKEIYRADSVSILVYNPFDGEVKATANYPTFNPNNYNDAYLLRSVTPDDGYVVDDETQIDVPVYVKTGGRMKMANSDERTDTSLQKYIPRNIYGARVFVDKNFSSPYEPGSIFKVLTVAIGLDSDEIDLYDHYDDPGQVKVGEYTIANADKKYCSGELTFLDALTYSCNVGMVRIGQRIQRSLFYNYLRKMGFGKLTGIEISAESPGLLRDISISRVGYFNNTFGQGILVTPLQMVVALGTILNGGYYVQPTIVRGYRNNNTNSYTSNKTKILKQIFKPDTAEDLKKALFIAMSQNPAYKKYIHIPGKFLGGKSGTSEIAYRGIYRRGAGRTNGSYIGVSDTNDPRYIILVQVRRPRTSQRGVSTAGVLFGEVANFISTYSKNTLSKTL